MYMRSYGGASRNRIVWAAAIASLAFATVAFAIPMRPNESSSAKITSASPTGGMTDELHDLLHKGEELRQRDPIKALSGDMSQITDELAQEQTNAPVQAEQRQVVSQLDKLIAELSKQTGSGSGSSNNPTKPLADSKIVKGPGGSGPMHDPQAGVKGWGQLPAKDRDRILQSQNDGFPAGYEAILSSYYNRLAQEQVGDEGKAAPATQP